MLEVDVEACSDVDPFPYHTELAMAVLLLFWPARISTQTSVLHALVSLALSGAVTLMATDWKVEPNSRTITVPLPRWATPVVQGVLRVRPALCRHSKFLWGAGD